jgi:hypothetical protein
VLEERSDNDGAFLKVRGEADAINKLREKIVGSEIPSASNS